MEAQVDESGYIWLMVHSGSRHTGLRIANYYNDQAVEITRKRGLAVGDDLASLPLDDQLGQDFLHDMAWSTDFALENRKRMMRRMVDALHKALEVEDFANSDPGHKDFINIHHNFAQLETIDGQ
jgi:tRNA-splicing ligase RtcB (3'-phosphate/5'-hydroxy nucleic acid ligase)